MTRPQSALVAILLTGLIAVAIGGLAWGAENALGKSDDLLRRSEEAALFVRGIDPYQDPDMTYPPSAPLLFAPLVAPFEVETLKKVWLVLNLVALAIVGESILKIWGQRWPPWVAMAFFLVIAASKPTRLGIGMGQFALIPLALMLVSVRILDRVPVIAGILIGLALAKPTMSLPVLGFLAARRQWRALCAALFVQGGATIAVSAWLQISPIRLTSEWLALARGQQAAGLIDVPTIVQKLIPGAASGSSLISIGLLLATFLAAVSNRRRSDPSLAGFCLISAAFFSYHRPYDLVLLFPALATLVTIAVESRKVWASIVSVFVSIALIWPSKPGVGSWMEWTYEITFVAISYLLLIIISWELTSGSDPEAAT